MAAWSRYSITDLRNLDNTHIQLTIGVLISRMLLLQENQFPRVAYPPNVIVSSLCKIVQGQYPKPEVRNPIIVAIIIVVGGNKK